MLNKIVSVIMSFAMSFTSMFYTSFNTVLDSVTEMLFGVPYSTQAIKDDFFSGITDSDVEAVSAENGYVKDLVAVFIDSSISFSEKVALFAECGGSLIGWSAPLDLYILRYNKMTYNQVIAKCNFLCKKDGVVLAMPVETYKSSLNATPNDPFDIADFNEWDESNPYGANWHLEAIDARQAWDYSDYFSKINIGIVDAGFDLDHPEFKGRISFPSSRLESRNVPHVHGCHVAGIIGANRNNGIGVSGICDNSELICVDWYPETLQFWFTELAIFFGFSECVKAGAKVVNLSLGTSSSRTDDSDNFIDNTFTPAAVSLMMASLISKGYDFIAVQSAGNGDFYGDPIDARHNGHFASVNENNIYTGLYNVSKSEILNRIIVVTAAENLGNEMYMQPDYSNIGPNVDIAAPGESIYSCSVNSFYTYLSGTSMAAPVVTGVASLVWSVNPSLTGPQVKDIVCSSTDSIARYNDRAGYYDTELTDYPMVNARLAVEEALLRTNNDWGTVRGTLVTGEIISYNGMDYTIDGNGEFSFVAPEGSGRAVVLDAYGEEIGCMDITIIAGETTLNPEFVEIPEILPEETTAVPETTLPVETTLVNI